RANSWVSALAPGLAIRAQAFGKLNPWRRAFGAVRVRPRAVFGPVLARAFLRLALILRSLVMPHFLFSSFGWHFKFAVLDLLHATSQRFAEDRPMADRSRAGWRCGGSRQSG